MNVRSAAPLALALLAPLAACTPTRQVYDVTNVDRPPDVTGDSLAQERARARIQYREVPRPTPDVAPDRSVDVISTSLDLSFDFARRAVVGSALHRVTPLRDSLTEFYLHAVGMEDLAVWPRRPESNVRLAAVPFDYDSTRITIRPSQPLRLGDTTTVYITYTAFPERRSGDAPLFAGNGLYFIDPDGTDPYRPTQIWTQGETEDNRRWFPTWDYPNDKMTFEIALTVPDSFRTVSNGTLVEQAPAGDGLRRDRWALGEIPQVAYLAAAVAGRFATVTDAYVRDDGSRVPLEYVVEPRFEAEAQRIFGETPAMMRAFEAYTGVLYPWPNYKQVTVRDFTAGGMENTTATVMFEGLQSEPRGALGNEDDARDLISHELAHQWFGDLVTTEDWANIALNESFATFFEMVYREAAFGRDTAQDGALRDRQAYFGQASQTRRPIVWYGYGANEGQVFDTHSYQKGGQVLRTLRFELGDDVFRRGLRRFLTEHAGESVEMDDLRQAMEEESGQSLVRFFDQWFYQPGHPALDVEQAFFPGSNLYTVRVTQTQDRSREPVFAFDVNVELNFPSAPRQVQRVRIASADTTLRFAVPERPSFVRFNEGEHVLAEVALDAPVEELAAQARQDDELAGRASAVAALGRLPAGPQAREALLAAARDAHPHVRQRALAGLARVYARSPGVPEALLAATRDGDAEVREAAWFRLAEVPADSLGAVDLDGALQAALADSAYIVVGRAALAHVRLRPRAAYDAFEAAGLFDLTTWGGLVEGPLVAALDTLGDRRGAPYVTARTGPNNPNNVRAGATAALGSLAGAQPALRDDARATLRALVADRLPAVRHAAAEALGRIGTAEDLAALDAQRQAERDEATREAIEAAARRIRAREDGTEVGRPNPFGDPSRPGGGGN